MTVHDRSIDRLAPGQRGLSLIELMVALAIGLFLVAGAITIFANSRTTYRALEATARLQESARFALDVVRTDVRMAGYFGLHNRPDYVTNRAANSDPVSDDDPPANLSIAETVLDACDDNHLVDFQRSIDGIDAAYFAEAEAPCAPGPAGVDVTDVTALGSDLLIVRRASTETEAAPALNRYQVVSSRLQSTLMPVTGQTAGTLPSGYSVPQSEVRDAIVNAYYVSPQSTGSADMPSLRRKRVIAGPAMADEEIMPGVEDLQFEIGIDESTPRDGIVDRWENPGGLNPNAESVVAVRIWLRVRAETPEVGFVDGESYQYANMDWTPTGAEANFRRMLVSETLQIRNTRR